MKFEQEVTQAQSRWLTLSTNARQVFAQHNSECIQFDDPDTIVNTIREVYDRSRNL